MAYGKRRPPVEETEPWTVHRARVAGAMRRGNTELAEEARRDMRVAKTADHIRELMESWPAPTPEQCERLADLLRPKK